MDSFPEEDKLVILNEIQRLREAIDDGKGHSNEFLFCSSDESDMEECDADPFDGMADEDSVEETQYGSSLPKNRAPWLAVDESDNDYSDDESGCPYEMVQKTQAYVEQGGLQNYSASNVEPEASFVKKQSFLMDVDDMSAIPEDQRISVSTPDHTNIDSDALETSNTDVGSLEWALQLNRDYQEIVTEELMRIDSALRNNKSMQAEIESQSSRSKNPNMIGYSFFGRFRPTYLKDSFGQGPPENEDSRRINALKEVHPFFKQQKAWKEKERHLLAEGVRNQNLERITLQLKQELNELKSKRKDDNTSSLQKEIKSTEKKLEDLKKVPPEEFEKPLEGLDFTSISRVYLPERTEKECRVRWLNLEHPAINHSKWTKEENSKLKDLAEKYNKRHWERVAQELGTQRTPVQCFQHFQKAMNKAHANNPWTKDEDELLLNAVKVCTKGNWLQVSGMVEGKTPAQCLNRYDKCLKPGLKKGPWSKEENKMLLKYVDIYGPGQWKKISEHIPGRSDTAVRERWVNNYDRSLKLRRKWSKKEDILLLQAVDKCGASNWTKVAKYLPGRTDNMCWRRWKAIQKEESSNFNKGKLLRISAGNPLLTDRRDQNIPGSDYHTGFEKWKPRIYRKKLDEDTAREELPQGYIENNSVNRTVVYTDNNHADICGEKISYKDDEEASIGEDDADQKRAEDDPEYLPEDESSLANEIAEGVCFLDPRNQAIFEEGERVIGRYDAGIVSYVDAKRSLYKVKSKIKRVTSKDDRKKLVRVNSRHMEELDNIHVVRNDKDSVPVGKKKQSVIRIDVNESVHGVENMGARSLRPVNIGHLPEDLAPFTVLLEVFRIDYQTIMQKLQARAGFTASSSSNSLKSTAAPSRMASSTASPSTITVSPSSSLTASSALRPPSTDGPKEATLSTSAFPEASSSSTTTRVTRVVGSSSVRGCSSVPSPETESPTSDKSNRMQKGMLHLQSHATEVASKKAMPSKAVVKVTPIAPNLVTMRAFRKLLLHREKLNKISKSSPLNQSNSMYSTDENQGHAPTKEMTTSGGAVSNSNVCSKPHCASFADTSDYKTLSARFNALFMWPLLLLTHEARCVSRNGPTKELVFGKHEQSGAGTMRKTFVQQDRTENSMNERQELISHGIIRRGLSPVVKETGSVSHGKGQDLNPKKVPKKRARPRKKRKKRSIDTGSDSDIDESFCSGLADVGISAGRARTRGVASVVPNAVSISKEPNRKCRKVTSR